MEPNDDCDEKELSPELVNLNNPDELFDGSLASNKINLTESKSRRSLMDDFLLNPAILQNEVSPTINALNLFTCSSNSRTVEENDSQMQWSNNILTKDINSPLSPKIPIRRSISSDTIDRYKPTTIEKRKHGTPGLEIQKNQGYQILENSPHFLSVKKRSSLALEGADNSEKAEVTDGKHKSFLERKESNISVSSPFHKTVFKNEPSQNQNQKNCLVLDLTTETENNSLASRFPLVSSCHSMPIPMIFESHRFLKSSKKTPKKIHIKKEPGINNNITPTPSCNNCGMYKSRTSVKKEQARMSARIKLQLRDHPIYPRVYVDKHMKIMPLTQSIAEHILCGVVAFIEIRIGNDIMGEGVKAELEFLGAVVENSFTEKVTHCFFHRGRMSTYKKAIDRKIPLVSSLWIEACKAELSKVSEADYEPKGLEVFKDELPLFNFKLKLKQRSIAKLYKTEEATETRSSMLESFDKIMYPVVESKLLTKRSEEIAKSDNAVTVTHSPTFAPSSKGGRLIDILQSADDDIRKATQRIVLTSTETKPTEPRNSEEENIEKMENSKTGFTNSEVKGAKSTVDHKTELNTTRKRKSMAPVQVEKSFEQDSSQSISESLDVSCLHKTSPNKTRKNTRVKFVNPEPGPSAE